MLHSHVYRRILLLIMKYQLEIDGEERQLLVEGLRALITSGTSGPKQQTKIRHLMDRVVDVDSRYKHCANVDHLASKASL